MIGKILIAIGVALLLGVVYIATSIDPTITLISLESNFIGTGFDDTLPVPPSTINTHIAQADRFVQAANDAGVSLAKWSSRLELAVLILTSLITIMSGLQALGVKISHLPLLIGLLGIVASVTLGTNTYIDERLQAKFTCVDEVNDKLRQTLADIRDEPDPTLAESYLKELVRNAKRCAA